MTPVARLGIVGVGLIGGSVALAARRAGIAREIVGLGRTRANLDVALQRGIVDRADNDPRVLEGADFVVLATPVGGLAAAAAAIRDRLAPGAIATDAGSVKASVVDACSAALGDRARFVGAHPIAGTEDSGAAAADADVLLGARCVLTPTAATDRDALARVRHFWEAVGMRVSVLSPDEHDAILALTSHVPHLLAFALAQAAVAEDEAHTQPGERPGRALLAYAGPSFRSATRVASSSPETWRDILLHNRPAVLRALELVRARLDALTASVRDGSADDLTRSIAAAGTLRRRLEEAASPAVAPARRVERVAPARGPLLGTIDVPGDKSIAHRALLFGGIARGTTVVRGVGGGEDNASTIRVLRGLGVEIERSGDAVRVAGRGFAGLAAPRDVLDCGNSGTTMRLMCGLLAGRPFASRLDGDESLRRRPMRRIIEPLTAMGAVIESDDGRPPLLVRGGALRAGQFRLAVASAQVKTALVLAGLQADGETAIEEPALSRDHTERLLPAFGGALERRGRSSLAVRGPQELRAAEIAVPGDPSSAAFWLVAASVVPGSRVAIRGVGVNPTRGGALDVLRAMGARIREVPAASIGDEPVADLEVEAAPLHGTTVAGETMLRAIDEFPILAVAAAYARGETRFLDAGELRVKESDRIAAMAAGLARLGVAVEELRDGLVVRGGRGLRGGDVEAHGDHRIAMAFAVAALGARGEVAIHGAEAIAVSYPEFPATLESLRRGPS